MKVILAKMRRAINDYDLIQDGDKIAVGLSGGKDSLTLLTALAMYRRFSPQKFELIAISIDLFNGQSDFSKLEKYCKDLEVPFYRFDSQIYDIVFKERKESNPCSLCAKFRRGMLNNTALKLGCNKVALGHHADDLIETFLLSMFYEGRLSTFKPKTYLTKTGLTIIRPLLYVRERDIIGVSKNMPIFHNNCPADKHTQRQYMKELIRKIQVDIPFVKDRMIGAIISSDRYNLFPSKTNNNLLNKNTENKDNLDDEDNE
jgi:tRNA 2-thiocytidine biosynthesis protein TtcA